MKSLRRSIILIIFLLVSVATMATGVFAWFIGGDGARVGDFGGSAIGDNDVLEIDAENEGIFLGDRVRDLVYLLDSEYAITDYDFYGFAAAIELVIINPSDSNVTVRPSVVVVAAPEFGVYAGNQAGLRYLVLEQRNDLTQRQYMASRFATFQASGNVFSAMNAHNNAGYSLPGNSSKRFFIYLWGNYDGLTTAQKEVYHALVYRVQVMV